MTKDRGCARGKSLWKGWFLAHGGRGVEAGHIYKAMGSPGVLDRNWSQCREESLRDDLRG